MKTSPSETQEISLKKLIIIFVTWVAVTNLFGLFALNRLNLKVDAEPWVDNPGYTQQKSWNPFSLAGRWDAYFYQDIAKNGYWFNEKQHIGNIAFFPLYPLTIRATRFFTRDYVVAGWVVSLVALFGALLLLTLLIREFHPQIKNHGEALIFLLIFPTAIFFMSVYSEALFLFFALLSVYCARKQKWWIAGIFGALAALTRFAGVTLVVLLGVEFFQVYGKKFLRPQLLSLSFIPGATLGVFFFHKIALGNFWAWFEAQKNWGRTFDVHFVFFGTNPTAQAIMILNIFFVLFGIILIFPVAKHIRFSYGMYMLASIALPLLSGTTLSMERFLLVMFPIPIFAASLKNPLLKQIWAFVSILLFGLFTTLYVNGYWAG